MNLSDESEMQQGECNAYFYVLSYHLCITYVHVQQRSDHTGVIYRAFVVGPLDAIPNSYIPYHMMISSCFFCCCSGYHTGWVIGLRQHKLHHILGVFLKNLILRKKTLLSLKTQTNKCIIMQLVEKPSLTCGTRCSRRNNYATYIFQHIDLNNTCGTRCSRQHNSTGFSQHTVFFKDK